MNKKLEQTSWELYFLANRWKLNLTPNHDFRDQVKDIMDRYATNKASNLFLMGVAIGSLLTVLISIALIN